MNQDELQKTFEEVNKILSDRKATLSDVKIIALQLNDMVENFKLQNAIRDFQTFMIDMKIVSKEQIEEYIQNKINNKGV